MTNKHGANIGFNGYSTGDYVFRSTQNAAILLPYRDVDTNEENSTEHISHVSNPAMTIPTGHIGYDDMLSLPAPFGPYDDPTTSYSHRKRKNAVIEEQSGVAYHQLSGDIVKMPRLSSVPYHEISQYRGLQTDYQITNPISMLVPTTLPGPVVDVREPILTNHGLYHVLQPLGSLPQYLGKKNTQNRAKRRCKLCSCHCSYYCEQCSDPPAGRLVCYCNPFTTAKKPCYFSHLDNLSNLSPRSFSTTSSSTKLNK